MRPNLPLFLASSNAIRKPGGLLKWKMRLVQDVRLSLPLTEAMKIVRLTSPLPDVLRLSLPKPRLRHDRRFALLYRPNLCTLLCFFAGSSSSSPNFPNCFLPGSGLRSSSITRDPIFLSPSQRPCVAEPEATFPSFAEPRALRSLTRPFAPSSSPTEFLAAALISPHPLPLAQTKLPIPC